MDLHNTKKNNLRGSEHYLSSKKHFSHIIIN